MPARIQDRFSALDVSRQRKYQLRQEAAGLCRLCGQKAKEGSKLCPTHAEEHKRLCHAGRKPSDPREDI